MKNAKKIKETVEQINRKTEIWLETVKSANECAMTDRILEDIVSLGDELKTLEEERWKK